MSGRYLTGLADWCRAAGLEVVEYDGWQTRARSSGGYAEGRPWCVMWHHTASSSPIENDAAYCAEGNPDAPVCNLLIARDGAVTVIAAGASNTNGKGYAMGFSRGVVPDDSMNTYAVGFEICNDGLGEPYPAAQIDAVFAASLAVCAHLGLEPTDAAQHVDWAPDRKIDPATAAAVQGGWRPGSINGSGSWALADLRAELADRAGTPPPTPVPVPPTPIPAPPLEEDHTMVVALDENGTAWLGDGITRFPIHDESVFNNYVVLANSGAYRLVNTEGGGVRGWPDVYVIGADTLAALGRAD